MARRLEPPVDGRLRVLLVHLHSCDPLAHFPKGIGAKTLALALDNGLVERIRVGDCDEFRTSEAGHRLLDRERAFHNPYSAIAQ